MHELSIAHALIRLAESHRPASHRVKRVSVQVGPLRAIETQSMQWAWQAATEGSNYAGALLDLEMLDWILRCSDCGRTWPAATFDEACACGSMETTIDGGDELLLMSMDVVPCAGSAPPAARRIHDEDSRD
jgi:hydrogenase nickel incorporation protein HypA/HybF